MRFTIFLLVLPFITQLSFSQVKVSIGTEIIPTYKIGKEEVSPMFYTGRSVQGAEGRMYPYPSQAKLGDSLVDVSYEMIYLENEYLLVKILPQFGGKLFSAIDKTNGHELFHTNSVIKPDLIGTLGAWISGGIEWCFPHHHRTTTMLPSDYRIVENADGSVTVWIGETEKTMRIRGIIGITLRPGCSYIESDYRINNTNPLTKTFLFWANVAVTADSNFRTFWPPSQEIAVYHNNRHFTHWPISNVKYHSNDYTDGVDLTWWKNHPYPESFFFWESKDGFIGGYDYASNAGMVHVGDPYKNKTSKLWQFGPGLQGQNARRKLTDDGKAYVELMTGTFSNNQPDYSWIAPHSAKKAKNYWYPLRDIEVAKNANINASITLQMKDSKTVFYGFNTTQKYEKAKTVLEYKGKVVEEKVFDIDPSKPFTAEYKSDSELDEYDLKVQLFDKKGEELISYVPYKLKYPELPETQEKVKRPEEIESVEDLYLTGRFIEQFYRPGMNPDDYYLAALKKSPNDYRCNIALGVRMLHKFEYEKALGYLTTAANKLRVKYYQPKNGDVYYYLALAQLALGLHDDAYRNFSQATWYYEWFSAGNYQLALIESKNGNYTKGLEYIEEAYSTNNNDSRITVLYSAISRKLNKNQKALELIDTQLSYDPLNFAACYEKYILDPSFDFKSFSKNMQDIENNYIEIATNYLNAGLYEDGLKLLELIQEVKSPLVYYYKAYFIAKMGQKTKAKEFIAEANNMSFDYCFPFRKETEAVLNMAIKIDYSNAKAYYLLGNLLYDKRPDEAIANWEEALKIDDSMAMVWRNLAFSSFYHENNVDIATNHMKKAIERDNTIPQWFAELSMYYDVSSYDFKECLAILEQNIKVVEDNVAAPKILIDYYNLNGDYDKAINFLNKHHFRTWEGGRGIYWKYVDAHVIKALKLAENNKYTEAVKFLEKALEYPENLEVARSTNDEKNAMIYYYMGVMHEKNSNKAKAKEFFQRSVDSKNTRRFIDLLYYQALSHEKLGEKSKAQELYATLIEKGKHQLEKGIDKSGIGVEEALTKNNKIRSEAYYLQALGYLGKGKTKDADKYFDLSLQEYKNNLWAKHMSK